MMRILVALHLLACSFCISACGDEPEVDDDLAVRIENSIEGARIRRADFSDFEDVRRQHDELIRQLAAATPETLASPRIMIAYAAPEANEEMAVLYAHWICSEFIGSGIRVAGGDHSMDLVMPEKQLGWNRDEARKVVIFGAEFWFDHDSQEWQNVESILASETPTVVLLSEGTPISKPHEIAVIH